MSKRKQQWPVAILSIATLCLGGCGGGNQAVTPGQNPTSVPPTANSTPHPNGVWTTLNYRMPLNPVHAALLHNGKVLIVQGSGNDPSVTDFQAAIWDVQSGSMNVIHNLAWDMFCNGMTILQDGRVLINGGTLKYSQMAHVVGTGQDDPFEGLPNTSIFDPDTNSFSDVVPSVHGRWYPTILELNDGRAMTFSGLDEIGNTNQTVEIYTVDASGTSKSQPLTSPWSPELYPRMHLLPDGKVFYSAPTSDSHLFDPATNSWVDNPMLSSVPGTPPTTVAWTIYGGGNEDRTYGSSVLLPLTPGNNYNPKVFIMGGDNPATDTTEVIDLGQPLYQWEWQPGPRMAQPRVEMEATILPSGKVLVYAGSAEDENVATASLKAELYDPATNTFSSAGSNSVPRLYHNVGLLLPDATVVLAGGNPAQGVYEDRVEIYKPAYLFNADGTSATRPTIGSGLPSTITYGTNFTVPTPDAGSISSVALLKPGSVTHSFDMDQRYVGLSFTVSQAGGSSGLTVTGPPNSNIAPPGYYMLFLINSTGVPSVASFVQVTGAPAPPSGAAVQFKPLIAAPAVTPTRPRKVTESPLPLRKK
jgi:hypothetical protein